MNKLVDSESLGKFKELMDEKLKNKVSKKKKSQVIIGKAIKPRACEIGGMENWYAFAGLPSICLPKDISSLDKVYAADISFGKIYFLKNHFELGFGLYRIVDAINAMWRVDRYEINEDKLSIWLSYKLNSRVQKGTSTRFEIKNGRKYDMREITPNFIADVLNSIRDFKPTVDGVSSTESYNINLKRFQLCYRNSSIRKLLKPVIRKVKLKWRKLSFVRMADEKLPVKRLRFMAGKYKISFINNKRRAYSPPVTFFLRKTTSKQHIDVNMITIE